MQRTEKQEIYTRITNQIVSHLEKGVRPWVRPWNAEHAAGRITRPLRHNGKPYSGINVLSLWASAMAQNFAAPIWMTFRQASELDAHIRKGEKGSLVVYADSITRKETDEKTGGEIDREIPFLKGYTVFNVEQIDGLPEVYYAKAAPTLDPVARIDHAEKFFAALGATIRHGGNRACYSIAVDAIQMPPFESFQDADSYYATLAHECTHWTGSKTRLDRDFGGHRFGSEGLRCRGTGCRTRGCFPVRRSGVCSGTARRSRILYRNLAESVGCRQPSGVHRRSPCTTRRRVYQLQSHGGRRASHHDLRGMKRVQTSALTSRISTVRLDTGGLRNRTLQFRDRFIVIIEDILCSFS
jgi:antirestriction protein ArdC